MNGVVHVLRAGWGGSQTADVRAFFLSLPGVIGQNKRERESARVRETVFFV